MLIILYVFYILIMKYVPFLLSCAVSPLAPYLLQPFVRVRRKPLLALSVMFGHPFLQGTPCWGSQGGRETQTLFWGTVHIWARAGDWWLETEATPRMNNNQGPLSHRIPLGPRVTALVCCLYKSPDNLMPLF